MGFPKPLLRIGDETFLALSVNSILTVVPRLVVVLGGHAEQIRPAIPNDPRIVAVENPRYQAGQLSSLKVGLGVISGDADAVLVHLADHPLVKRSTFERAVAQFARRPPPLLISPHPPHRAHPLLFPPPPFPLP